VRDKPRAKTCALCKMEKSLCKSHIIPEFFYRNAGVYNDDHTFSVFTIKSDLSGEIVGDRRSGIYERLLCSDCENYFRGLDDYAAKTFWGGTSLAYSDSQLGATVEGLDYTRMKLFEMSLVWRISVCGRSEFKHVRLLRNHESRLRQSLLNETPLGQNDYGCAMIFLVNPPEVPMERAILLDSFKNQGQNCIRLVLAGFLWIFVIACNLRYFRGRELFLREDGTRIVPMHSSVKLIDWLSSSDLYDVL